MKNRLILALMILIVATSMVYASGTGESNGPQPLSLWYHGAGNKVEREILIGIINDYNTSQSDYVVELEEFPQISYNDSVSAAALSGTLPDIIDVDGPIMPNWAWGGYMAPLDIPQSTIDNFLPGTIGRYDGKVHSIGLWDAAVAMFARKSVLTKYGIRIPTLQNPWTLVEFNDVLKKLDASGEFEYAFDVGMNDQGEWYPYAFSPFLQSFGGDMIDRSTFLTAEGALNGPEAVAFGKWWANLVKQGYTPGPSQDSADRETGFVDGRYALQWNGNWAALNALSKFGDDLLFLPAPDFGAGNYIGAASWQFGVSATSKHKEAATDFIEFAIQGKYLAAFSDGLGLIPSTAEAAKMSKYYNETGAMKSFYSLSSEQALIRPPTPGYVVTSKVFLKALMDIANGANVQETLDAAVDEIDLDIENNNGYGF